MSSKGIVENIRREYSSSLKSNEVDDWVDVHLMRPLAFLWVKFFAALGVHPNAVTILSMFVGAASLFFFAQPSYYYGAGVWANVIGILLLLLAYIFDCTDGQLARLTGKHSKLGRILDGSAGYAWYIPIYAALVYRFYLYHGREYDLLGIPLSDSSALLGAGVCILLAFLSGAICLASQQRTADYYVQIHLLFSKGMEHCELDSAAKQRQILDEMPASATWIERLVQRTYIKYTEQQEKRTPEFQNLMSRINAKYGNFDNAPQQLRNALRQQSKKAMRFAHMLVFNFRTFFLALFCLLDFPLEYFLFEIIVITLIERYTIHRHEAFCRRAAADL